jgi:hypothetical protein
MIRMIGLRAAMNQIINHMHKAAVVSFCTLVMLSSLGVAHAKTVALVYDDSQSMAHNKRWNPANYAMQIITALMDDQDTLWLVRMSAPFEANAYRGVAGIEGLLRNLKRMGDLAKAGTPYPSLRTAIDKLPEGPREENWLIVVTDADGFSDFDEGKAQKDIEDAVAKKRAHVAFLLIENPGNNPGSSVVDFWVKNGQAFRIDAPSASDIPGEMEKLATLLAHSAGQGGLSDVRSGNEIVVSSQFPLRRLTVLRQDDLPGSLDSASHTKQPNLQIRQLVAQAQEPLRGTPSRARIYHMRAGQVMDPGKDAIRLQFDAPTEHMHYKLIPDVAARFEVVLKDDHGKPIQRDANGYYSFCLGTEIQVEARLLDDSGKPITLGRNDLASFDVGINQSPGKMTIDSKQERFVVKLKPTGDVGLTAHAKYPGYFHLLGEPMQLHPGSCAKDIRTFVKSGLDTEGVWMSPLDAIKAASFVHLTATVDGRAITAEEFARWRLHDNSGYLDVEKQGTDWLIRPRSACCAYFWSRPDVGLTSVKLMLESDRSVDRITLPPDIKFNLTSPETRLRQVWWLACPYVVWIGTLIGLWWVWRVMKKERFGPKAKLWVNEPERKYTYTVKLRAKSNWFLRWFWPSAREQARVDGMTLYPVGRKGRAIIVSGKSLGEHHEIDGWLYDEVRKDRGNPQPDARVLDGGEIGLLKPHPTRFDKYTRRYRYTATASQIPQDW